jgi:Domain of unknown function (DUF4124)
MKRITFYFFIVLCTVSNLAFADGKKIVKWVDSSGVTQYGDKMPASEAGRNNSEMNKQGMVVKKNVTADKSNEALDQQKLEQERRDKILLASYTKADEIDLARDRNLQMDQAAVQALNQQKINITNRTSRNNKTAEGFRTRKKPLPAYLSDELKLSKTESANVNKQLAQRKLSMEATRKRYAEEKERFIALKYPDGMPVAMPVAAETSKAEATPTAAMPAAPKPNASAVPTTKTAPAKPK